MEKLVVCTVCCMCGVWTVAINDFVTNLSNLSNLESCRLHLYTLGISGTPHSFGFASAALMMPLSRGRTTAEMRAWTLPISVGQWWGRQ
jgi:hypothetical protein